jgi:hypothetical protein
VSRNNQKITTFVSDMPTVHELKLLTRQRLDEADDLIRIGRVDAGFYLAGYAIELALKAAICKTLDQPDFYKPDRTLKGSRLVQDKVFREFKTHNYSDLLVLSGLSNKLDDALKTDVSIATAWRIVTDLKWSENDRYEFSRVTLAEASDFVESTKILTTWISNYW